MSDLNIDCPHCQQSLEVPQEMLGDEFDCPSCDGHIQLRQHQPKLKPPPKRYRQPQPPSEQTIQQSAPHSLPSEPSTKTKSCPFCGEKILSVAIKCKHSQSNIKVADESIILNKPPSIIRPHKSHAIYVCLGVFLGGAFGTHNFYAKRYWQAFTQLLIVILSAAIGSILIGAFITGVWALVEVATVSTDGDGILLK